MTLKPRIAALVFYVRSIDATRRFYHDAVGIEASVQTVRYDEHRPEEKMMTFFAGETTAVFFEHPDAKPPGKSPIVVFEVDEDIEAFAAALTGRGVTLLSDVSDAPGGRSFDFADPDGHVLSIYQPMKNAVD